MATTYVKEQPDLVSSTDNYAGRFSGPVGQFFLDVQWRTVRDMLPSAVNCRVLDVGGGHAQLALPMVNNGYDVTILASDGSCRSRLDREVGSDNYKLVEGDLLDLPLPSNSFDVVVAFRMLPHLNNWQRFIGEICRVAKRFVIVDYPDLRSVNWFSPQMFALKKMLEDNTRPYRCFRRKEIVAEFELNEFPIAELSGQFFLPMALHRWIRRATFTRTTEGLAKTVGLTHLFGSPMIIKASLV